jgi:beta-1,2-mannobiose phosphorylase / 1,2-beta-oligomannan phosphorylase
MKKALPFFLIFFFNIYFGCSNNLVSPSLSNTSKSGQVALKISGGSIPNNVVKVTAILSQLGKDTLKSSVEPIPGSSAELNFTNVFVGTWHLKVNADNNNGVILYTGDTDIQINAGEVTNVTLTLVPTNQGTGGVFIQVNWGNQNSWIDYLHNPIFTSQDNPSLPNAVSTSKILYDNGIYKMWYLCTYDAGKANVWYAESQDGINWQNKFNQPVFDSNISGTWDDYTVGPGAIIKDNEGNYRMYYNGWSSQYGQWQVGLATSADGIHWERYDNPVLKADSSNEFKIGVVSVIVYNNIYYMYYSSSPIDNYDNMRINLATSPDGLNWAKYSGNPILSPTLSWEGIGVTFPAVIYDNNHFIMIYSSSDRTKFGIAYSQDGIIWTKNSSYIFSNQMTNNNWSKINYPFLMKVGNEYKLYYTASTSDNSLQICLASTLHLY